MRVLITGSAGLVGSEAVEFFDRLGFDVDGVDNNMRADFFGPRGDTTWNRRRLEANCKRYRHVDLDIRNREGVDALFARGGYGLVLHAASQPSHDLAAARPFDDWEVNATGTLNLLEACRRHAAGAAFVFVSTNKVYGDNPNKIPLVELPTRWDYADPRYAAGIPEDFPIEGCLHSLFGVSKLAADVMTQEYGRYFGLKTGLFRAGCVTGPYQSGAELHGFLGYLVTIALEGGDYTVFGYKGKQVRDQIHAADLVEAFWTFAQDPDPGAVYNMGGGRANAASLIECVEAIARRTGKRPVMHYRDEPRRGDHICYYTDLSRFMTRYPAWRLRHSLDSIVDDMVAAISRRVAG
jgi:CDP-paratose 2-epimerase